MYIMKRVDERRTSYKRIYTNNRPSQLSTSNAIIGKVWVQYEPHQPPSSLYADYVCGVSISALREPIHHASPAAALLLLKNDWKEKVSVSYAVYTVNSNAGTS
jgi:hypothetical protein